jgi:phosphonoacetaldehyde hydrolase
VGIAQYFDYSRRYRGPVRLVVLDWAGLTLDYGCYAPAVVFIEVFKRKGIQISMEQARAPMGRFKRDHIKCIFDWNPDVTKRWREKFGQDWRDEDVDDMYENSFKPMQLDVIRNYSKLIPGTLETVKWLRERGIKIGSTTGYFKEAAQVNLEEAIKQGYKPDATFCSDDVPAGRPYPWMVMKNMLETDVFPPEAVVKVDDTVVGVEEGLNAGTWAIGVSKTGTLVGLNEKEIEAIPEDQLRSKVDSANDQLRRSGAHYVIEEINQLPQAILDIEERLKRREKP